MLERPIYGPRITAVTVIPRSRHEVVAPLLPTLMEALDLVTDETSSGRPNCRDCGRPLDGPDGGHARRCRIGDALADVDHVLSRPTPIREKAEFVIQRLRNEATRLVAEKGLPGVRSGGRIVLLAGEERS